MLIAILLACAASPTETDTADTGAFKHTAAPIEEWVCPVPPPDRDPCGSADLVAEACDAGSACEASWANSIRTRTMFLGDCSDDVEQAALDAFDAAWDAAGCVEPW